MCVTIAGSLFRVRCLGCQKVFVNKDSPICEALAGRGAPEPDARSDPIPVERLPRCGECGGFLRPHIVWFGESLEREVIEAAYYHLEHCDLCLVVKRHGGMDKNACACYALRCEWPGFSCNWNYPWILPAENYRSQLSRILVNNQFGLLAAFVRVIHSPTKASKQAKSVIDKNSAAVVFRNKQ